MNVTDELLQKNAAYTDNVENGPLLPQAKGVAVVACMDARLNVYGRLGLQEGDAHLIRNAGGAITDDEILSLTISQLLPGRREAILIHHTDSCDTKRQYLEGPLLGHPRRGAGGRVVPRLIWPSKPTLICTLSRYHPRPRPTLRLSRSVRGPTNLAAGSKLGGERRLPSLEGNDSSAFSSDKDG
jgi:hypothetical protein